MRDNLIQNWIDGDWILDRICFPRIKIFPITNPHLEWYTEKTYGRDLGSYIMLNEGTTRVQMDPLFYENDFEIGDAIIAVDRVGACYDGYNDNSIIDL